MSISGGAYSAPPDPLTGYNGPTSKEREGKGYGMGGDPVTKVGPTGTGARQKIVRAPAKITGLFVLKIEKRPNGNPV